jgi:hypothetical protein
VELVEGFAEALGGSTGHRLSSARR